MHSDRPVIRTYDLTKRFRRITAVSEVSFEVRRSESFGFLGLFRRQDLMAKS